MFAKKFFSLVLLLCFSTAAQADVIYEKLNFDNYDEDASCVTIKIDSDGKFTQTSSQAFYSSAFYVFKINGKSIMLSYNHVGEDDEEDVNAEEVNIAIYNLSDMSKPIAAKKFSGEKRPNEEGTPAVWGNHILLPCHNNTIIEIDPETCSVINTYTHDEPEAMYKLYDVSPGAAIVNVYNNKIYATFDSVMYEKLTARDMFRAADSSLAFSYTVEMSSLGNITGEMSKLYQASLGYGLRTVDGDLYDNYSINLNKSSVENGLYKFKADIDPATAEKISFPSGVLLFDANTRIQKVKQDTICSDGAGGIYFVAYDTSKSVSPDNLKLDDIEDIAIYHYSNGAELKKVYTIRAAKDFNGNRPSVSRMRYDKQSGLVFIHEFSYADSETDIDDDDESINFPGNTSKLIALKLDASGSLVVVREFEDVSFFDTFEAAEDSNEYYNDKDDNDKDRDDNDKDKDKDDKDDKSNENNDETTDVTTPEPDNKKESGGSGGCNLGWGVIFASSIFMMKLFKKS